MRILAPWQQEKQWFPGQGWWPGWCWTLALGCCCLHVVSSNWLCLDCRQVAKFSAILDYLHSQNQGKCLLHHWEKLGLEVDQEPDACPGWKEDFDQKISASSTISLGPSRDAWKHGLVTSANFEHFTFPLFCRKCCIPHHERACIMPLSEVCSCWSHRFQNGPLDFVAYILRQMFLKYRNLARFVRCWHRAAVSPPQWTMFKFSATS